jgi:hypothetical protein
MRSVIGHKNMGLLGLQVFQSRHGNFHTRDGQYHRTKHVVARDVMYFAAIPQHKHEQDAEHGTKCCPDKNQQDLYRINNPIE